MIGQSVDVTSGKVTESSAILELAEAEQLAQKRLSRDVWDFIAGGSGTESTLAGNRAALDQVRIVPRMLVGAGHADTTTEFPGGRVDAPVAVAPMAYQRLVHPDGELALAAAARSAGAVFISSLLSSYTIEEIASVGAQTWFQLYWLRDRLETAQLISRAEQAGCRALMLTVDVPRMGRRLRDMRNAFALPSTVVAANLTHPKTTDRSRAHHRQAGSSAAMVHTADAFDPTLNWDDLAWLRERTCLPLVLKGILHPQDAARAAALGIDAIVVSNHGGRQLDGAIPAITALPPIVQAVAGRCPVLFDSGVRGGLDVLRALAWGATGVLLGRPALWGLSIAGEQGAAEVIHLLRTELEEAMVLAGCPDMSAAKQLTTSVPDGWTSGIRT
jgi:4-hydroxymandelate oxidase